MAIRITQDKISSVTVTPPPPPPNAYGNVAGYDSGGGYGNGIDKFSFSADGNATDVGDLSPQRTSTKGMAGHSSAVSGYNSGGTPADNNGAIIDKFPFASGGTSTDVGDLSLNKNNSAGSSSDVSGYTSGGQGFPSNPPGPSYSIDKFPFAVDANGTNVGDLASEQAIPAGQSSPSYGYSSGGTANAIEAFSFASDGNAANVGNLTSSGNGQTGCSSDVSGYTLGGGLATSINTIDKFPFASNGNATDVGDLTQARRFGASQSSTESGYGTSGYSNVSPINSNTIDKFPFATDANATDVGDLTKGTYSSAGQQI